MLILIRSRALHIEYQLGDPRSAHFLNIAATVRAILLAAVGSLLIASCGDRSRRDDRLDRVPGSDTAPTMTAPPPVTTSGSPIPSSALPSNRVGVRLVEDFIEMPNILPAGETTFLVRNDDRRKHSFQIEGPGLNAKVPEDLAPGEGGIMKVELKTGRYRVFCPVEGHASKYEMSAWINVP